MQNFISKIVNLVFFFFFICCFCYFSIHKFVQDNFREGKLTTTQLQQYQRLLVRLFKTTRSGWRGTPDLFLSLCRAWMKEIFESNDPFSTGMKKIV